MTLRSRLMVALLALLLSAPVWAWDVTIDVNSTPSIDESSGAILVCIGQQVSMTFTAQPSNYPPDPVGEECDETPVAFQWTEDVNGTGATSSAFVHTYDAAGIYYVNAKCEISFPNDPIDDRDLPFPCDDPDSKQGEKHVTVIVLTDVAGLWSIVRDPGFNQVYPNEPYTAVLSEGVDPLLGHYVEQVWGYARIDAALEAYGYTVASTCSGTITVTDEADYTAGVTLGLKAPAPLTNAITVSNSVSHNVKSSNTFTAGTNRRVRIQLVIPRVEVVDVQTYRVRLFDTELTVSQELQTAVLDDYNVDGADYKIEHACCP